MVSCVARGGCSSTAPPPVVPNTSERANPTFPDENVELSDEELAKRQKEFDETMENVPSHMFEKFGSKHPVTHQTIIRNPNAKGAVSVAHSGSHASIDNLKNMKAECAACMAQHTHFQNCKTVRTLVENRVNQQQFMSADELENAMKTVKQAALNAELFYRNHEEYLAAKDVLFRLRSRPFSMNQ
jgi:hypothetical protein